MQYMDENESDDHDMKNNQQSAKICVTDHTIDDARDDERVQTSSKEGSIVVTPIVTGNTDCEESDRGQRRPIYQSDTTLAMYGEGHIQSRDQSDKIVKDGEERCEQHEEDVYLPKQFSSSISTTQECMEGDQSRDWHEAPRPEVKMVEVTDIERGVSDLLQGKSIC